MNHDKYEATELTEPGNGVNAAAWRRAITLNVMALLGL